jgi:NAD(P)H dehydrogenase (quinone)
MRLLFILTHPDPESFSAALCSAALDAARMAGHDVRLIDLCAEGFNPVMRADEWRGQAGGAVPEDLQSHVQALRWTEGVIFVHPTWWSAQPAVLKGWLDRVWRPGVAFTLHDEGQRLRPALGNIRLIGVITTFGVPWWQWTILLGAPGRKILLRGLRACTNRRTTTFWLGLHAIETRTDADRRRYVDRVRARMTGLTG